MANNTLHRYLFEDLSVRGELVQLDHTYEQIILGKTYPQPVKNLLGELLVATTLLTATLKFEGSITLQLQGDGPLSLAVINGDNAQKVRGVARFNEDAFQIDTAENMTLHELMGKGHLVITITPKEGERYQGIVALEGENLTECFENYFERSEQLKTRLWLRIGELNGKPHAAGMLLQVLPDGSSSSQDFEHLEKLTETIKNEELFSLPAQDVLYRLYNQDKVQLFPAQEVEFSCGCSRERSAGAIITIDRKEIDDIINTEGKVSLHCEYCGTNYDFDSIDIANLFAQAQNNNNTIH